MYLDADNAPSTLEHLSTVVVTYLCHYRQLLFQVPEIRRNPESGNEGFGGQVGRIHAAAAHVQADGEAQNPGSVTR
jgi:hypothetical protein